MDASELLLLIQIAAVTAAGAFDQITAFIANVGNSLDSFGVALWTNFGDIYRSMHGYQLWFRYAAARLGDEFLTPTAANARDAVHVFQYFLQLHEAPFVHELRTVLEGGLGQNGQELLVALQSSVLLAGLFKPGADVIVDLALAVEEDRFVLAKQTFDALTTLRDRLELVTEWLDYYLTNDGSYQVDPFLLGLSDAGPDAVNVLLGSGGGEDYSDLIPGLARDFPGVTLADVPAVLNGDRGDVSEYVQAALAQLIV